MEKKKIEFKDYTTLEKWDSIHTCINNLLRAEDAFSLRRRVNPHHKKEQVREETRLFRTEQYAKWSEVKELYVEFRDELSNTFGDKRFVECRNILERIFTVELDEALRQTLEK